ncbi:DUF2752 domain-containing protein [Aquimarina sp. 2201CG1-2-11]|uniref:DUF2752 domain-containing protein n=1 Tax=Aquimarina discodermiae TaxID=3231043 RepID=UPI0034626779
MKIKHIGIGIVFVIILCLYYFYNPTIEGIFPKCPFYSVTGLYCPGCGSQRALHQLLHFNLLETINYNALYVIGLFSILYNLIIKGVNTYFNKGYYNYLNHPKTPIVIGVIIIIFWILRNISSQPFCYLAP